MPDPVGGIITLDEANAIYYLFGAVNIGENTINITAPNIAIMGRNPRVDAIVGSTSGTLITSSRGVQLEKLSIINPDGYAIDLDGNGTDHILLTLCGILFSKYAGSIRNALVLHANSFMVKDCEQGIMLMSSEYVSISDFSATMNNYVGAECFIIPAGQSFENIIMRDSIIKAGAGQVGISIDPSTSIVNKAVFKNNIVYGGGTALNGVTKQTNKFWFADNSGILDSKILGGIGLTGNTETTTISVAGTFVNIGAGNTAPPHATFTADAANERISLQGTFPTQSIQYDGYEDEQFNCMVALSVATSGGAEKNSAVRLLLNGNPVTGSEFRFISKGAGSVSYNIILTLSHGDNLRLQVTNLDDTASLIVYSARLSLVSP